MTLTELQTALKDLLGVDDGRISTANQTLCLNLAQRRLCAQYDLPFSEGTALLATVAGTRTIAVPATPVSTLQFSRPWVFAYTDPTNSSKYVFMKERDHDWILNEYGIAASQSTGEPLYYSVYADQFWLGPTPSTTHDLSLWYYGCPKDLSAGSDTNNLTIYWWPLLLFKACSVACAYMLEDDRVQLWEGAFKQEMDARLNETNRRLRAGRGLEQLMEAG